jgi:hypothetical protein
MKTHNWILPAGKHAKIGPATRLAVGVTADSPAQTARAMLILALVVGGGTESATLATSSASAVVSAAKITTVPVSSAHAIAHPWMA